MTTTATRPVSPCPSWCVRDVPPYDGDDDLRIHHHSARVEWVAEQFDDEEQDVGGTQFAVWLEQWDGDSGSRLSIVTPQSGDDITAEDARRLAVELVKAADFIDPPAGSKTERHLVSSELLTALQSLGVTLAWADDMAWRSLWLPDERVLVLNRRRVAAMAPANVDSLLNHAPAELRGPK